MGEPFFKWSDSELGLGVREMDREHQELVQRMNALYEAVQNKEGLSHLKTLVQALADYTVKHFADEEAHMEKMGFSGLATHKIMHKQLLQQFGQYVDEFKKTGTISERFFSFLRVWLTSHIRGIDMKYAEEGRGKKTG